MIERKLNSGRSILEMLGVLAIVAVITLMGLGLIRFLINYAEAYSTIKSANETAVELRIRQGRGYLVENYWMFNANITTLEGQRVLTLAMRNTASEGLCKAILRQAERNTEIIHVEPENCTADNNQVVFYFAFDEGTYHSPFTGDANTDKNDPLSGGCAGKSIQNGACFYEDENCILRKDVGDSCGSGSICLYEGTDFVCRECPEELPDGVCRAMDGCDGLVDKADGDSCGLNSQCQSGECVCTLKKEDCPERYEISHSTCSCYCPLTAAHCGSIDAIDSENCLCVCDEGYTGYSCGYTCPTTTEVILGLSKSACEACGNSFWKHGICYNCGYSLDISFATNEEAMECVNACAGTGYERYQSETVCYPYSNANCPSITSYGGYVSKTGCEMCGGDYFWNNGTCYGCGYSSKISFDTKTEAQECKESCAGSEYERFSSLSDCALATGTSCPSITLYTLGITRSVCEECIERDGVPRIWNSYECYGCGYSSRISFDTEAEAQNCEESCAGSEYEREAEGTTCYLKQACPLATSSVVMSQSSCQKCIEEDGIQRIWKNGICYGCGYSSGISFVTEAEAQECENVCANSEYERYQDGMRCYKSDTSCPSATLRSSMSQSSCQKCIEEDGIQRFWKNGICYGCGYSSKISFDTEAEAQNCEESCAGSEYEREAEGTTCYLKQACPSATSSVVMSQSSCQKCIEEDGIQRIWKNGICYGCGYSSGISFVTEAEAQECENVCANSEYERYQDGMRCYKSDTSCPSATLRSSMSQSSCQKCIEEDGIQRIWRNAKCYGCGYSSSISFDTEAEAQECENVCANSEYERYQDGKTCYLPTNEECPSLTSSVSNMSETRCKECGDSVWKDGVCYGCGYSDNILFDSENKAKECMNTCTGTKYERYQIGEYCYLAENTELCPPSGRYVGSTSKNTCRQCGNGFYYKGACYNCDYSGVDFDTEAEAEECVNSCANSGYERMTIGTYCTIANTGCPLVKSYLHDVPQPDCEKCDNTIWKYGVCYGCGYSSKISFDTEAEAQNCEESCAGSEYEREAEGTTCYLKQACPLATSSVVMSQSSCQKCIEEDGIQRIWKNGICYGCGYSAALSFDTNEEAEACMNACAGTGYERYQDGTVCKKATTTSCPYITSPTSNISKSVCEECGNTIWEDGTCYACGYSSSISFDTEAEAEECVNSCANSGYERMTIGTYCALETNTECPSETSSTSLIGNMSQSSCQKCVKEDGIQRIWSGGRCHGCGTLYDIYFSTETEAKACSDVCARSGYERYQDGTKCYGPKSCPTATSATSNMSKTACEACEDAIWNDGVCYGCGSLAKISFDTEEEAEVCVAICENSSYPREIDESGEDYYCGLK